MTIDGLAAVQARINAITGSFSPDGVRSTQPVSVGRRTPDRLGTTSFADLFAKAQRRSALPTPTRATGAVRTFVDAALRQAGDRYVWGAETTPNEADPSAFDCSELVQWAGAQAGMTLPDGSWLQYMHLEQAGRSISVDEALRTPGALLFRFSQEPTPGGPRPASAHVAISLGDGRTIEARGSQYGVGVFETGGRKFTHAAVVV